MKKITLFIILILSLSFLVSCGKTEIQELGEKQVKEDLELLLKEEGYSFDTISELKITESDLTEEDLEKIKSKFTSPVPVKKINLEFVSDSTEINMNAKYSLIYAYVNENWKLFFFYKLDFENWVIEAKNTVSTKQILDDLSKTEIEGFKEGFIGSTETTTIKIISRNTDLKNNQDNVVFETTVNTDFATYTFSSTAIYFFKNGKWEVAQIQPDNIVKWNVEYFEDKKPEAPTPETIFEQITNPESSLFYIANKKFLNKSYMSEPVEKVGQNSIIFEYVYISTYNKFGDFQYLITVPFDWLGGHWTLGKMKLEFVKSSLKPMIGTWKAGDNEYFVFTSSEKNTLKGTYYITVDKVVQEYKFKCSLDVPLKENEWKLIFDKVNIPDGVESHFNIKNAILNLEKGVIVANNKHFVKGLEDGLKQELFEDIIDTKLEVENNITRELFGPNAELRTIGEIEEDSLKYN